MILFEGRRRFLRPYQVQEWNLDWCPRIVIPCLTRNLGGGVAMLDSRFRGNDGKKRVGL